MESGQPGRKISGNQSDAQSVGDKSQIQKFENALESRVSDLDAGVDIRLPGDVNRPVTFEQSAENTERVLKDRPAINREPSPHKVETIPEQNGSVPIVLKNAEVAPPNSSKRENPAAAAEPTAAPGRDRSQTPGEESKSVADTIPGAVAQASPQVRSDVRSNAAQLDRGLDEGPKAATTSVDRGVEGAPPGSSRSNANEPKAAFDSGGSAAKTGLSPDVPSVTPLRDASKESPVSQAQQGPSRPGESVETRLGTGKGLDSTEYGVTNAQAKPVQDLMRQSTPPQVEGSRLTATPVSGAQGAPHHGESVAGQGLERERPSSLESPPSEVKPKTVRAIESVVDAGGPKADAVSPVRETQKPPVKSANGEVSEGAKPPGLHAKAEIPIAKSASQNQASSVEEPRSDGSKQPGRVPPLTAAGTTPQAASADGRRGNVQNPIASAGNVGGTRTEAPSAKAQGGATKSGFVGTKGEASNAAGKQLGDARSVKGQTPVSSANQDVDARSGKERAVKQVDGSPAPSSGSRTDVRDGGRRGLVDAPPHRSTGKVGPLDAMPAGIRRVVADGRQVGSVGNSLVSQNDKRGDGVTARIQPDRKPLIEGVRSDIGNVRTDAGKGRADRIQAAEGRAGSTRNQGAEARVPATRSGESKETGRNENVKIESSRLDGAKSQNARGENEVSKTAKSNANPSESARTEGGRGSQKFEPAKTAGSEVTKIGPSDATPAKGMSDSPSKVGPKAVPLKNNDSPAVKGLKDVPTKKGPFELAPGSLEPKPNLTARPKPPAALPQAENPHGVVRGDKFTARPLTPFKQPLAERKPTTPEGDGAGFRVPLSGIRNAVGDLGQNLIDKISRRLGEPKAESAKTVPVIDRAHHPVEIRAQQPVDSRLQKPLETKPTPFLEAHTVRVEQSEFRPMTGRPNTADGATKGFDRLRSREETPVDKPAPKDARPARREGEPIDGRHSGEAPRHIRDVFLKFNISIPKRSFHPSITDSGSYVALDDASSQRLNTFISSGTHKALKAETEFERRSNRSGWLAGRVSEDREIAPESDSINEDKPPSAPHDNAKDEKQLTRSAHASTAGDTARKIYIVQAGDTSESIALVQLHDQRLAGLLESINEPMLQTVFDIQKNMHIKVLPVGALILLPNNRDIAEFRERT